MLKPLFVCFFKCQNFFQSQQFLQFFIVFLVQFFSFFILFNHRLISLFLFCSRCFEQVLVLSNRNLSLFSETNQLLFPNFLLFFKPNLIFLIVKNHFFIIFSIIKAVSISLFRLELICLDKRIQVRQSRRFCHYWINRHISPRFATP